LAKDACAHVWFSIPFFDENAARAVEPGAPTVRKRFETMEILAKAGVPVASASLPSSPA